MTRLQKVTALCCTAGILAAMLLFIGSISSPSPSFAAKGGGGGGKPPKDDPPPHATVLYCIEEIVSLNLEVTSVWEINNLGMVVGFADTSPYLYDHTTGRFYDLNVELSSKLEPGWIFRRARAINDLGEFVGSIEKLESGDCRGYVVETFLSTDPIDWIVTQLPTLGSNEVIGLDINFSGDILASYWNSASGVFDRYLYNPWANPPQDELPLLLTENSSAIINNRGEVAGAYAPYYLDTAFHFDPNTSSLTEYEINGLWVHGFNDAGVICGRAFMKINGKGPTRDVLFRYSTQSDVLEAVTEGGASGGKQGINSSGDIYFGVYTGESGRPNTQHLLHTGFSPSPTEVILNLDDLIAPTDPLRDEWFTNNAIITAMTDRNDSDDVTGYPILAGKIYRDTGGDISFILTPFIPDP